MDLSVLFEDNHLLVVNKPAGTLVHGDKTGDISLDQVAKNYLKVKYNKPGNVFLGVCHRLDRPVSGVLVFARTSKALTRLNRMFQDQHVEKKYLAISDRPSVKTTARVVQHLLKDMSKNRVSVINENHPKAKRAVTHCDLISTMRDHFLFELRPETGRTHQLRMALSTLKAPILGDLKYGGTKIEETRCILLHCHELKFPHPTTKQILRVRAPMPALAEWNLFRGVL